MFDFIPIEFYTPLYFYIMLLVCLMILLHSNTFDLEKSYSASYFNFFGYLFLVFMILYIGLRPIHGIFTDMKTYAKIYERMQNGNNVVIEKDVVFNTFMKLCSSFISARAFFFVIAFIYIMPCYLFAQKYFHKYWFYAFFMFAGSFSFWAYGTNGLRNGIATAVFIWGLCYRDKKILMYSFFFLSYLLHASLVVPVMAFLVSGLYKKPKIYIYIWLATIPLSLAGGSAWNSFFASLGFEESRTQAYLTGDLEKYSSQFSKTGFRWDFLLFSGTAVYAGYYFIFKKNIVDKFYIHLFGTYCIANAFWILVITAAFSNRFAYLSWFLMPVVIAYPICKYKIWKDQYRFLGVIIFLYYLFTFVMNIKK